ncbi:hypothetical protein AVEN_82778-1 [Araneus ventricosus]|uniref:Uncharacterized protein n=1 Tax=Araneus ventricosus TaxID=182803 RepID=A0A4Y2DCB1_ARAVE|nr:hypothetical protein AVEN_82778-1 [Araneus ventricosus]
MQRLTILNTRVHLCDAFRGPQRNSAPRENSKLNSLIPRRDFFLLASLKPGLYGRKRLELDSLNQGGHLLNHPTPAHPPSLKAHGNGLWLARIIRPPLLRLSPKLSQNLTSPQRKSTA